MSESKMEWGATKMLSKFHKEDCAKLDAILDLYKTMENFPNCFGKDDSNPDKVTIEKLGLMNTKAFGKYTRQSFAAQVRTRGNRIVRNTTRLQK